MLAAPARKPVTDFESTLTQVVRQSSSERIERLLDGFQLRWEEGV